MSVKKCPNCGSVPYILKESFYGKILWIRKCSNKTCAAACGSFKKKTADRNWNAMGYIGAFKDFRQGVEFYHKVQQFGLQQIK